MAKFSRVQSIAARRNGRHVDLSDLFGVLCDVYLDRYDATTRASRGGTRKPGSDRGAAAATDETRGIKATPTAAGTGTGPVTRTARDAVIRRDGGRCTFVDRNGERCTETIALQVDHVRPRALGGTNDPSNLRAMCAAHNRLLAERTFGRRVVERAIEGAPAARRAEGTSRQAELETETQQGMRPVPGCEEWETGEKACGDRSSAGPEP